MLFTCWHWHSSKLYSVLAYTPWTIYCSSRELRFWAWFLSPSSMLFIFIVGREVLTFQVKVLGNQQLSSVHKAGVWVSCWLKTKMAMLEVVQNLLLSFLERKMKQSWLFHWKQAGSGAFLNLSSWRRRTWIQVAVFLFLIIPFYFSIFIQFSLQSRNVHHRPPGDTSQANTISGSNTVFENLDSSVSVLLGLIALCLQCGHCFGRVCSVYCSEEKNKLVRGLKGVPSLCTLTSCHPMFFRGLYVPELSVWKESKVKEGGMCCHFSSRWECTDTARVKQMSCRCIASAAFILMM